MSAFNLARYNQSKFNVIQANEIWLIGRGRAAFGFSYAGITNYTKGNAAAYFITERLRLDPGRLILGSGQMTISNSTAINGYHWRRGTASTMFSMDINMSQIAYVVGAESSTFDGNINLSQEAYVICAESTVFDPEINLSQIAFVSGSAGEVFSQTADVISLSESVCLFPELVLKPGQTLIIDAGSYNVLLDGKNAIYLQQGDWLDNLSRDTINIVASATGVENLQIQILYVERYL